MAKVSRSSRAFDGTSALNARESFQLEKHLGGKGELDVVAIDSTSALNAEESLLLRHHLNGSFGQV